MRQGRKRVELHLHLEGAATPRDALFLASKYHLAGMDEQAVGELYTHHGLGDFLRHFGAVAGLLREPTDLVWLLGKLLRRLANQRVIYAEIRVSPSVWERHGLEPEPGLKALCSARFKGAPLYQFVVDGVRQWDRSLLERDLNLALQFRKEGVAGFGLGGDEVAAPARLFAWLAAACREERMPLLVHAGEVLGPEEVARAVDILGAKRIGHGIGAAGDPVLMRRLAGEAIHLEVCPSSNYATGAVPAGESHPVGLLVKHGVAVSLSTDDPGLFSASLAREERIARRAGLSEADITRCNEAAARAALLAPKEREALAGMV